ncbi:hypothetical protein VTN49DRAFT_736 [Thermomyces lanuginosus]|uniref:uncharacterized protein n=1 Tax=Thermomyces lanuginosus TaxID=5541 RepID=UPI0037433DFF
MRTHTTPIGETPFTSILQTPNRPRYSSSSPLNSPSAARHSEAREKDMDLDQIFIQQPYIESSIQSKHFWKAHFFVFNPGDIRTGTDKTKQAQNQVTREKHLRASPLRESHEVLAIAEGKSSLSAQPRQKVSEKHHKLYWKKTERPGSGCPEPANQTVLTRSTQT